MQNKIAKYVDFDGTYSGRSIRTFRFDDADEIEVLILSNNSIMYQQFRFFSNNKWNILTSLSLSNNLIGSLGCKYLSQGEYSKLLYLVLNNNQIRDVGVLHLSKTRFKRLQKLSLTFNLIRQDALHNLVRGNWPLRELKLDGNFITYLEKLALFHDPHRWKLIQNYRNQIVLPNRMRTIKILQSKFDNAIVRF